MSIAEFRLQIGDLTRQLAGKPLDAGLQSWLNRELGRDSASFAALEHSCRQGVEQGWLCQREGGGIRYGRVFKAEPDLQGFSVDVVDMDRVVGPEHRHPNGEIDLVMPLEGDELFDGHGRGWVVYPPGSVHKPTVSAGRALVLYLLPDGVIEFI